MSASNHHPTIVQSLRKAADTGLAALHTRAELFAVELQEEKSHLIGILIGVAATLFFAMAGVLVFTAMIIMFFPDDQRKWVALGFCVLYLVGAAVSFTRLKVSLNRPLPFSETINELKKDRECLFN